MQPITALALAFSLFIIAVGVLGLVAPSRVLRLERYFQAPPGLFFAVAVRLVLGAALFLAAPQSRAPELLRILGAVIIVAGIVTLSLGLERFRRLIDWWSAQGPRLVRVWAVVALALGFFLAWALSA